VSARAATRHRLFFALWPDAALRERLAAYARAAEARCGGRVMRPQNLHLTLAFLGDIDPARLQALGAAAARVEPQRFVLEIDRAEYWRHNRIVWAGAAAVPGQLARMADELRAALDAAGFSYDRKPFVPHVTLLRDAHAAALPPFEPLRWPAEGFVLARSEPGRDYEIVGQWRVSGVLSFGGYIPPSP
jgi:2'-5' RNA ligase